MSSEEIRKNFFEFFEGKGHKIVVSSSLLPDDPSVLLTTAGMQQFKRYYTGELNAVSDFGSRRTVSIQKCFRTSDIGEVGDKTHLTFFEMMGNFSFGPVGSDDPKDLGTGGYLKRSSIHWGYEYLTQVLGVNPERITVSIFAGDKEVSRDRESYRIWFEEIGIPKDRIIDGNRGDNFWGPTGNEGPCGPTTEIYVDGIEVWNIVFNQYYCHADKKLEELDSPGVDTGMGFERLVSVIQGADNVFETDLLHSVISKILELAPSLDERVARIFTDHLRGVVFLLGDGLRPGNKEAGYILRRLIRRLLAYQIKYDIHADIFAVVSGMISAKYSPFYPELENTAEINGALEEERSLFNKAVAQGLKELAGYSEIDARKAFYLYETFGLPLELVKEMAKPGSIKNLNEEEFNELFAQHQEVSRAGSEKKFGGHGLLLDTGEIKAKDDAELKKALRLHTATHLLQQALRDVLGPEVKQMGSDVNAERTRFDFSFGRKLTADEITAVESRVREKIKEDLIVSFQEMPKEKAVKTGALHFFKEKYPDKVKVYFIAPSGKRIEEAYSKEFCGGPHVDHTLEIGEFKIVKEEAVGAGVRRIRAIVE